jgi:serine/threonine protein kinase
MEYCENSDLRNFINQYKEKNKLIDQNIILFILLDICTGLKEIHNKNIIHRDLKPDNLFISKDFKIKIGDFGFQRNVI